MKKIISLLLSAVLLCTAVFSLSSCGYRRKFNVRMTVKDYGVIDIELDGKAAPITVKNFVKLVKAGFYDGRTFHRVVDGFMIQGGDPKGDGTGGTEPIKGEFLLNGYNNPIATSAALSPWRAAAVIITAPLASSLSCTRPRRATRARLTISTPPSAALPRVWRSWTRSWKMRNTKRIPTANWFPILP